MLRRRAATPARDAGRDNATVRTLFIVGRTKGKLMLSYDEHGRNFDEVLRSWTRCSSRPGTGATPL